MPCYNFRMPFWKWVDVSLEFFTDVTKRAVLHPTTSGCTCRSSRYKINCKSQWRLVIRDSSDRLYRNMDNAFCARVEKQVNNKARRLLFSQKSVFPIFSTWYEYHPRRGLPNSVFFTVPTQKFYASVQLIALRVLLEEIIAFESPSLLYLSRF